MNTSTNRPMSPKKDTVRIDDLLREGIDAAKAGDKDKARARLQEVIALDQYNEKGWYWLASVVETDEEKKVCLGNVVVINPDNERAQQMLDELTTGSSKGGRNSDRIATRRGPNRRIVLLVAVVLVLLLIPILALTVFRSSPPQPIPTAAALDVTGIQDGALAMLGTEAGTQDAAAVTGTAGTRTSVANTSATKASTSGNSTASSPGAGTAVATKAATATAAIVVPTLPPTWTPQPSPTRSGTQTGTPAAPVPAGLTGHLVAISGTFLTRDRSLPLFILDPDGKNMRQITQGTDVGDYGAITPDGQRFIYARYVSSTNNQTLRISALNGTSSLEASTLWGNQPILANQQMVDLSRNGRMMVFSALNFSDNDSTADIYAVPVKFYPGGEPTPGPTATLGLAIPSAPTKGKGPVVATKAATSAPAAPTAAPAATSSIAKVIRLTAKDSGTNTWPAVSPDGKEVVFTIDNSGQNKGGDLFLLPIGAGQGQQPKDLTSDLANNLKLAPNWSPDGKKIAFQATPGGTSNNDIYIMNANGTEKVKLVSGLGDNIRPHWSPDGKYIAFSSNRSGKYEIWLIEVATKALFQVTVTDRATICTSWGS